MKFALLVYGIVGLMLAAACPAQHLPPKILGYKVQNAKSVVTTGELDHASDADIQIRLSDISVSHIGLLGATVNVSGEMLPLAASGKVDRLMFRDITINGVAVEVDDLTDKFDFAKGETVKLERGLHARLSPMNAVKAGFAEIIDSRPMWSVAGTVFVLCRVKKFGFTFKRIIPIRFSIAVKNPLI